MITVDVGQHFDRFSSSIRPSNLLFISMPPSSWMILIASNTVTSITTLSSYMSNVHNFHRSLHSGTDLLQQEWSEFNRFHCQGTYPCPVCRHGKITEMPLMETFACSFCQHIFSTNFDQQLLKMVDSQLPLTWYWNGKVWKGIYREGAEVGSVYLLLAIAFVLIPTAIIALGVYLFPPMNGSLLSWFPLMWTTLTFCAHLFCVIWLIIEYYQFPIFLYVRALKRKLLSNIISVVS